MSVELHFLSGARLGERLRVAAHEFQIGVGTGCEVALDPMRDPQAAGCRMLIRREGDGWHVRNLGRPGAWVNQQPLAGSLPLRSGDVIRLTEEGPDLRFTVLADVAGGAAVEARAAGEAAGGAAGPMPAASEAPRAGEAPGELAPVVAPAASVPGSSLGGGTRPPAPGVAAAGAGVAARPRGRWVKYGVPATALVVVIGLGIWLLVRPSIDRERRAKHEHVGPESKDGTSARPDEASRSGSRQPAAGKVGSATAVRRGSTRGKGRPQRGVERAGPRLSQGPLRPRAGRDEKGRSAALRQCVFVLALEPAASRAAADHGAPDVEQLIPFAAACAVRHKKRVMLLTSGWTAYLMQQFWLFLDDAGRTRVRFFAVSAQQPEACCEIERIFVHEAYARAHETLPDVPADAPANLGLLLVREPHGEAVAAAPHTELVAMKRGSLVNVGAVLGVSATSDALEEQDPGGLADLMLRFQQATLRRASASREQAAPLLELTWAPHIGRPAEGTPVFDERGRVVGVCTSVEDERLKASGISAESLAALWEPDLPIMWREFREIVREQERPDDVNGEATEPEP